MTLKTTHPSMRSNLFYLPLTCFLAASTTTLVWPNSEAKAQATTPDPCVDPYDSQPRENVCKLVNRERRLRGLVPLTLNLPISRVATAHALDMQKRRYFSHITPEGVTFKMRLNQANIFPRTSAENIAFGQQTAQQVVAAWMASAGHRKNILNPNFRKLGVGKANPYWGQLFTN